ncbi:Z-ring formation inhibitor MciZ [Bacillus suaedae]|uniref:Z-ring formation inhibitor MciZ n=1 Tax=Halalkalibacter suaedae TaxID=2822140 RepID=A0A940WZL0_9BACI|nr:Z-ring formation inhibitor MciZ [Bacillus suaedae]
MKVYIHQKGFILAGKAWEIRAKLKEASASFKTVENWIETVHCSEPASNASATAQKKSGSSSYLRPIV